VSKIIKSSSAIDKYDAHVPSKCDFIHDDYYISGESYRFSVKCSYAYQEGGSRRGFSMGVQKKIYRASSEGIIVDGHYVGKSDY
jgi:hypothetical protein